MHREAIQLEGQSLNHIDALVAGVVERRGFWQRGQPYDSQIEPAGQQAERPQLSRNRKLVRLIHTECIASDTQCVGVTGERGDLDGVTELELSSSFNFLGDDLNFRIPLRVKEVVLRRIEPTAEYRQNHDQRKEALGATLLTPLLPLRTFHSWLEHVALGGCDRRNPRRVHLVLAEHRNADVGALIGVRDRWHDHTSDRLFLIR